MKVEKVKINKLGSILYIVGFLFMLVSGILILIKTNQTDRMEILGWILLGVCGYFLYSKFDDLVYSKIRKKNKNKKKVNKKQVDKLVYYFAGLFVLAHIINIVAFLYLASTDLSNLAIFLLYFPIAFGSATLIIVFGFLIILWKNNFEIKKIIDKIKKKDFTKKQKAEVKE